MRLTTIIVLTITLSACGSMMKNSGIIEAQNALDKGQYTKALECTEFAESFGDLNSSKRAKLHYIRALAHEGLGMQQEAKDNYQYVVHQHSNSAYAAPSQRRLNTLSIN